MKHNHVPETDADFEALIPCYVQGCLPASAKDIFFARLDQSPELRRKIISYVAAKKLRHAPFIARLIASPDLQRRVLLRLDAVLAERAVDARLGRGRSIWTRLARSFRSAEGGQVAAAALVRIEPGERDAAPREPRGSWRDQFGDLGHRFAKSLAMPRLAAAACAIALIEAGLLATTAGGVWFGETREYVALSQTPNRASSGISQYFVRFADNAPMVDVSTVLRELKVEIVAGPDAQGLYIVVPRATGAAAEPHDVVLSRLLSRPDLIVAVLDVGR